MTNNHFKDPYELWRIKILLAIVKYYEEDCFKGK